MNPKVRVAVRFAEDNLQRDIYVAEVAESVRLSRSRFSHLFKSEVGMSFVQYLKEARMEKACQLLETSLAPVKAITAEVGYNSPSHFEREFKKAHGLRPLEYRAQHHLISRITESKVKEKMRIS